MLVLQGTKAQANEQFKFKQKDLDFAKDLTKRSRQMTLLEIKQKWLELENMLGNNNNLGKDLSNQDITDFNDPSFGTSLRIFVSSSMSRNLLKSYAKTARNYGGVLVFNGLPEGSWHKLSELVSEISGNDNEGIAMQIDDEAFAEFSITKVPSIVLSKEEDIFSENPKVTFDKITGSIGIRRALEKFASKGQLQELASIKLKQAVVRDE
jgi:type-F conjugative transfer system pilin assembly protein TrbC